MAEQTAAAATAEAPKKDSRKIVLNKVPDALSGDSASLAKAGKIDTGAENLSKLASGKTHSEPRADFIRKMWATKQYDRSAITAMCRAFGDDAEMKYQIVFQATKGVEGGPEKTAATAPAETATA